MHPCVSVSCVSVIAETGTGTGWNGLKTFVCALCEIYTFILLNSGINYVTLLLA